MAGTAPRYHTDTSDMRIPHGVFRSVLRRPADIIDAHTAVTGSDGVVDAYSYFDNVLRFLDAHHGGEDAVVWPVLLERCAEARSLIGAMEAQHERIHAQRDAAGAALDAWREAPSQANATALIAALQELRDELEQHFSQEESEILPLASANMSPEEWGELPGHALSTFTGDKVWLIFGLIFEQMTAEEVAFTMTLLPPPVVDMWQTSGKAAFDDFVGRVRRASETATA